MIAHNWKLNVFLKETTEMAPNDYSDAETGSEEESVEEVVVKKRSNKKWKVSTIFARSHRI